MILRHRFLASHRNTTEAANTIAAKENHRVNFTGWNRKGFYLTEFSMLAKLQNFASLGVFTYQIFCP